MDYVVAMKCQPDLFEVVPAFKGACRLPRRLHRRKQERDQDADDRNDDQKFHQGKTMRGERREERERERSFSRGTCPRAAIIVDSGYWMVDLSA